MFGEDVRLGKECSHAIQDASKDLDDGWEEDWHIWVRRRRYHLDGRRQADSALIACGMDLLRHSDHHR